MMGIKLSIKFAIGFIKWFLAFCITPHRKDTIERDQIMLISEKGTDARDNGYHLFLWIKQHHPDCKVYYVISKDSPDRSRLDTYSDSIIEYWSFRSCVYFWKAKYLVSTHQRAGHTTLPFILEAWLDRLFHIYKYKKVCFLQHGVIKDFMQRLVYEKTHYDLFICGARPEHAYILSAYGYPDSVAKYTGLCRYDNLDIEKPDRQILVMPTWRMYLNQRNIHNSNYLKAYISLLQSPQLSALLERNKVDLVFYPHHMIQPYLDLFRSNMISSRIKIAAQAHYDVQTLLKRSALLVTDYSSVYFDFAYMKKPIVFYQFDYDEYRKGHFQTGWLDYKNSFGPVAYDESQLLTFIENYLFKDMNMEQRYVDFVDYCFPIRDKNNCQRVFDAIMHC